MWEQEVREIKVQGENITAKFVSYRHQPTGALVEFVGGPWMWTVTRTDGSVFNGFRASLKAAQKTAVRRANLGY